MNDIKAMLEKYWRAETTLEEEKGIADYFRGKDVDAELAPYRSFFDYVEEEKQIRPSEDFEARILAHVGLAVEERGVGAGMEGRAPVRKFNFGYAAAAALILCVSSLFLVVRLSNSPGVEDAGVVTGVDAGVVAAPIKDTYDDPEQALAAVRRALLVASVHMNEGKSITQKNMHRLNTSWQAATGN